MIPEHEYNSSCFICRKLANREPAGVHKTSLCFYHTKDELDHLRARNAEFEAEVARLSGWKKRCIEEGEEVARLFKDKQALKERERVLVEAVKKAYRKHWLDDPDIGYAELGTVLMDALCNTLGDDGFNKWIGDYHAALAAKEG